VKGASKKDDGRDIFVESMDIDVRINVKSIREDDKTQGEVQYSFNYAIWYRLFVSFEIVAVESCRWESCSVSSGRKREDRVLFAFLPCVLISSYDILSSSSCFSSLLLWLPLFPGVQMATKI